MAIAYTREYLKDERAACASRAAQYADDIVSELRSAATSGSEVSRESRDKLDELCRMLVDIEPVTLPSYSRDYAIDSRGVLEACLQNYRETVAAEVGVDVDVSCAAALGMDSVTPDNVSELEGYVRRIGNAIMMGDDDISRELKADVSVEVVQDVCHWLDERIEMDYFDANVFGLSGTAAYGLASLQDELLRVADDYERLRYEAAFGSPFEQKSSPVCVTADEDMEQRVEVTCEFQ